MARRGSAMFPPGGEWGAVFPAVTGAYFVDDNGPTDATHFTTIQAAVAAAPAGATIAIEAGTYTGSVTLGKDVSLIGRCPAQVTLQGAAATTPGIASSGHTATIRGLTITDFEVAVSADAGAIVVVEDAVLEANR